MSEIQREENIQSAIGLDKWLHNLWVLCFLLLLLSVHVSPSSNNLSYMYSGMHTQCQISDPEK